MLGSLLILSVIAAAIPLAAAIALPSVDDVENVAVALVYTTWPACTASEKLITARGLSSSIVGLPANRQPTLRTQFIRISGPVDSKLMPSTNRFPEVVKSSDREL